MKKVILIGVLAVVTVFTAAATVSAEEQEGFIKRLLKRVKGKDKAAVSEVKKPEPLPAEEAEEEIPELDLDTADPKVIVEHLTDVLTHNDEILDFVRDVRAEKDEEGNIFFVYTAEDGTTKRLEELDRATLVKILDKVNAEANRLNNERLIRQMEQVRQAQDAARIQQQIPAAPPLPPSPPRVYTPPAPPPAPTTPPGPPPGPSKGGSPPGGPPRSAPSGGAPSGAPTR